MSLDDLLFDGMFPDGSARRPGTCFCGQETSDVEEALCRTCLQDESGAVFQPESPVTSEQIQDVGVRLIVAAAASPHPRAVTTTKGAKRTLKLPSNKIGELFPGGRVLAMAAVDAHLQPCRRKIWAL